MLLEDKVVIVSGVGPGLELSPGGGLSRHTQFERCSLSRRFKRQAGRRRITRRREGRGLGGHPIRRCPQGIGARGPWGGN